MAEMLHIPSDTARSNLHPVLLPQILSLLEAETDIIAAMANTAAAIKVGYGWHWVGFYRVIGDELVLGPFQGPVACTRIGRGKGVCGTAWNEKRTIVVPDVDAFPGHIACSPLSRSEVVIPLIDRSGLVRAVLDVDSSVVDDLTEADVAFLQNIVNKLQELL